MPNQKLLLLFFLFWGTNDPIKAQNDKQVFGDAVFTTDEIAVGVEVTYLIRFQNLGNDTANNMVVRDTLDPRFDASTLKILGASHHYQLLRDQGFVRWYFNGIRLPSAQENFEESTNSTGYILYTVEPLRFLEAGQTILNSACITSDDEVPICTNNAAIWIDENAGGDDPSHATAFCKIVPNPNFGHFEVQQFNPAPIKNSETSAWWICDMNGKTIWDGASLDNNNTPNEVMLERPAPGLYMLWMKENGTLKVEQFAVIR